MQHFEIIVFFFVIAAVYASVGFGGGSSYLAVLAMYALPFKEIRLIALICNIIVVTGGTYVFIKDRQANWKKIIPLAVASVPMAFLGARMKIKEDNFFVLLGFSLIVAAILLWIQTRLTLKKEAVSKTDIHDTTSYARDIFFGSAIGFLSGMVGIGGGIFLSPLLNLLRWDTAKKIAATASVFILANSISGIAGQATQLSGDINYERILFLCLAVFFGGQIGSRLGTRKFDAVIIRLITAVLVFFAGIEVLSKHLSLFK